MTKKKLFAKLGLTIAKAVVPEIALVEDGIEALKSGKDKREAVLKVATGAVATSEFLLDKDLVNDADFQAALRLINDGNVLLMKAINRRAAAEP